MEFRTTRRDLIERVSGHPKNLQDRPFLRQASCLGSSAVGLPSKFEWKWFLLLRGGYVRELATASYPHIQFGGGDFPGIAGGVCGGWRLA